ncbi:glutathione S-transferase family protein [Persicimonas caeni]|uniref:glutathione S-transferase family protein n=1 Tax=Persicimonas caeni TaxID=2292766 RepID=UPI00143D1152|nr:glutathione S-transferase family protein [Persicimonas caeni]
MSQQEVNVYSLGGAWGTASASPFCLKLLTWLRMSDVPHRVTYLKGPPKSSTGKAPYIDRPDGSYLEDSSFIIETLTREHGVELDAHLSDAQRATAHMLQRTLENSLYFVMIWQRWIENWEVTREAFFGHLPPVVGTVVPALLRRRVAKQTHQQGIGRLPKKEIFDIGCADVGAVASVLGDNDWFFGEPSTTDAMVHSFFSGILAAPIDDRLKEAVQSHDNLVAHSQRIDDLYWT